MKHCCTSRQCPMREQANVAAAECTGADASASDFRLRRTGRSRCETREFGRGGGSALQDIMDTVSEVKDVKHAFNVGIKARKGVDY